MRISRRVTPVVALLALANVAHADPPVIRNVEIRGRGESAEVSVDGVFDV